MGSFKSITLHKYYTLIYLFSCPKLQHESQNKKKKKLLSGLMMSIPSNLTLFLWSRLTKKWSFQTKTGYKGISVLCPYTRTTHIIPYQECVQTSG